MAYKDWDPKRKRAYLDYQKKYRNRKTDDDPRYRLLLSSRGNASAKGIDHSISVDDIEIPERCPVFGFKLVKRGKAYNSPSLDRIDPFVGYIPGNVRVISFKANRLKNNGNLEDFRAIVAYLEATETYAPSDKTTG